MTTVSQKVARFPYAGRPRFPNYLMFWSESETPRGYSAETQVLRIKANLVLGDFSFPVSRIGLDVSEYYTEAKKRWEEETAFSSSLTDIESSPALSEIVNIGWRAVPFIVKDLRQEPSLLFIALQKITGHNPVLNEHRGNIEFMTNDWLKWATEQNIHW